MLTCGICGAEYERRPGRGRQSPFCSDECREENEMRRRRLRFQQRYHVVDTHKNLCVTCGSHEEGAHR
jgi:hypothetical protein